MNERNVRALLVILEDIWPEVEQPLRDSPSMRSAVLSWMAAEMARRGGVLVPSALTETDVRGAGLFDARSLEYVAVEVTAKLERIAKGEA